MKLYIAVDDGNNWLAYGRYEKAEDIMNEVKTAEHYDPEATIYIFEVVNEVRIRQEKEE